MSEPIIPTPTDEATELATLRRVNGELVAKSASRKSRIAELETTLAALQSKLTESATAIHTLTVAAPLKEMAESISVAPALWIQEFSKAYRVEMIEGKLSLLTSDGKPLPKPVPFERQSLIDLLTSGDDEQAVAFKSITIASRASGGVGGNQGSKQTMQTEIESKPQFGLR